MYVVLGATGNIGSQVVESLKSKGQTVIAVSHDETKASALTDGNVEGVSVDVANADALRDILRRGYRAFLLNPPAVPTTDTNAEELRTARAIAKAVEGSGLEKVVVASTYGAQQGDRIGDLSVLWEFEQLIEKAGVPTAVNRGAYYYTNLDVLIEPARRGDLPTPFPANFVLPMVSPIDLGKAAASRLMSPVGDVGLELVEGPKRYSFADVAVILSKVLGRDVRLKNIARDQIEASYRQQGFSEPAAEAYTRMTIATLDGPESPANAVRGRVTLEEHITSFPAVKS